MNTYDYEAYKVHMKHIDELMDNYKEWGDYTETAIKYIKTRFAFYYNGASTPKDITMTIRGARMTLAETRGKLMLAWEALRELEEEFESEVDNAE